MYFTEEHQVFRESFKNFLQKEVVPHIEKWEKNGNIDRFIWKKFGDMGYFGLSYPEEYGGLNLDIFYMVIFLEELQKINSGGFAAAIWAHVYLAMTHVNEEGDARIKNKYLKCKYIRRKNRMLMYHRAFWRIRCCRNENYGNKKRKLLCN